MRDIGKNIRELRVKKKLTQEELAEKLFVTRQTVSNYETGKSRPDIDMLLNISEVLSCDINYVLYGVPNEESGKRNWRGFLFSVCLSVLMGLPLVYWVELEKEARYWQGNVTLTLLLLVQPLFLILLGWTLMHGIELLTQPKPLGHKCFGYCYWIILSLVSLYFILNLPVCCHYIKADKVYTYFQSLSVIKPPWGITESFRLDPPWLNMLLGKVTLYARQNQWMFFSAGLLLRLFGPGQSRIKIQIGVISACFLLSLAIYAFSDSDFKFQVINPEDYPPNPPYGIKIEQWTD